MIIKSARRRSEAGAARRQAAGKLVNHAVYLFPPCATVNTTMVRCSASADESLD